MKDVWKQLSPTMRVNRLHGAPVLQRLNTVHGYYAVCRNLTEDDYKHYMSDTWEAYTGPKHEVEK